jgi:hypothetical protein
MDSFMWLCWRVCVWLEALWERGEHTYLVTLETPNGHRWQAPIRACGYESARVLIAEQFPDNHVVDVQVQS